MGVVAAVVVVVAEFSCLLPTPFSSFSSTTVFAYCPASFAPDSFLSTLIICSLSNSF